ncbi:type IVB secretion system protein IcmH/DotU [Methylobacterium persicinum]|uniref:type IVB secretion system protein IcmH/DotU n=1 Tax=Methylobacterium persicinum TaxID=374426 RepID=UPI001EE1672A|nr:type IVB secretion system protein IcmH/DotU [Methylobacterium persicinum]GJE40234.1 hypothetical protein KHHGKMAE_4325 [Methylobacterium persicinum]
MTDRAFIDPPTLIGHRPTGRSSAHPQEGRGRPAPPAPARTRVDAGISVPEPDIWDSRREAAFVAKAPSWPATLQPEAIRTPRSEPPGHRSPHGNAEGRVGGVLPAVSRGSADSLAAAAAPLLSLVALLHETTELAGVAQLRSEVIAHIHLFDDEAARLGANAEDIRTARYVLCSLIDETVMKAPWGSASDWSTNSLLNRFHNETWGGEKVFEILARLKAEPGTHIALLKLIDLVLLLGFEGVHRVLDDGRERLAGLSAELGRLIGQNLPPVPAPLSREWRGVHAEGTLRTYFPLWIVFAGAGLLLVALYSYERFRLAGAVGPVVERMQAIGNAASATGRRP